MKFGNTSLNPEAFKDTKKEDFKKAYAGMFDIDAAWKAIQKALPKKKNGSGEADK